MSESVQVQRLGAAGIAENNGRVLLTTVGKGLPEEIGCFVLPGGGVEHGEDPKDTVVREVREETGLTAHVDRLHSIASDRRVIEGTDWHFVYIAYELTIVGGTLRNEPDGATLRPTWIPVRDLPGTRLLSLTRRVLFEHFGLTR